MPNWWVLAGIAVGLILKKQSFLLPAFLIFLVFFPLFLCRMMGAGDIKAMALIAGYMGMRTGMVSLAAGFFIAGLLSLFKLLYRRELVQRLTYFHAYIRRFIHTRQITPYFIPEKDGYGATIPLTVCLFAGICIVLFIS